MPGAQVAVLSNSNRPTGINFYESSARRRRRGGKNIISDWNGSRITYLRKRYISIRGKHLVILDVTFHALSRPWSSEVDIKYLDIVEGDLGDIAPFQTKALHFEVYLMYSMTEATNWKSLVDMYPFWRI